MARHAWLAALAVIMGAFVGCQPAKELPDEIPKDVEPEEKIPTVPPASEPNATLLVEKAVSAYTGGKPELVAKGKYSRLVMKGKVLLRDDQQVPFEAKRTIAAVWPQRFYVKKELQVQDRLITEVWHNAQHLTIVAGGQQRDDFNLVELERNQATDEVAQHWMALFLPLTDPKAIVFDLKNQMGVTPVTGQPLAIQTLRLSLEKHPLYYLTFDANTSALMRVEYVVHELGRPIRRAWTMIDHKVGPNGLRLPSKMECRWDNRVKEEWEVEKWEFPDTINDDEFAPPKK
jgi:hypothetical protein